MAASWSKPSSKLLPEATLERLALDFEIGFCEKVLESDSQNLAALESLGNAYTRAGRIEAGLEVDRRLVQLLPASAVAHYNLACSLSLLSRVDEALDTLAQAIHLGYGDFDYLDSDPDLDNVRRDGRYGDVLERAKAHARAKAK
jgi:tetratricopeptide (TPR) repeat protein